MKTFIVFNILFFSLLFSNSYAQQVSTHVPWTKEDSAAINALVLYPDSVRLTIFDACEYPAVIVNVASIQKNSSDAFANLVSGYTKDQQEDIWNMTRYPGLISQLANNPQSADGIINGYPQEIRDVALKYTKSNLPLLKRIDSLQTATNNAFEQAISYYPEDVRQVFRKLLQYPEVLTLLNDHLNLAVRVGDHYKRDPQWVIQKADSANKALVQQNAQEVAAWKQSVQNDTALQSDLKSAANEYADSNGYSTSSVDKPRDTTEVNNYYCYPYSYWFGYPAWYPYAYWYPYPYWYDWGFYYGPYGNLIVFGLPSYYFVNWYFYYPWHWHHHPWLGGAFVHHYYGPRHYYNENAMVVHHWVYNNRNYLPQNFFTDRKSRVEAVKEIGKLNESVTRPGRPVNNIVRDNYIQNNRSKFPGLNTNPQRPVAPVVQERMRPATQPSRLPAIAPAPRPNVNTPQPRPQPQRSYNYNNINRAQDFHRSQWENTQPTYHPAPSPAPRSFSPAPRSFSPAPRSFSPPAPARSGGGGGGRRK